MAERKRRRKRLTSRVALEGLRGGVAEEHDRRRGLPAVRHRPAPAAADPPAGEASGPGGLGLRAGAAAQGPQRFTELERDLERTNRALRKLAQCKTVVSMEETGR